MKTTNKYLILAAIVTVFSELIPANTYGISWDAGCYNYIDELRENKERQIAVACCAENLPSDDETREAFEIYSRDPQSGKMFELRQNAVAGGYIEVLGLTLAWCEAVERSRSLEELSLYFISLGRPAPIPVENERAFAHAIMKNESIRMLTLNGNIQSLLELGDSIGGNQHINELLLELYNHYDRIVLARNIMQARIQKDNTATQLTITLNCGIPDDAMPNFADLIRNSAVTIRCRGLSTAAKAVLREKGILCRPSLSDDSCTIFGRSPFSRK